ncbi:MAG: adenylate/guanylate cyclase domain-containing protein, partial [Spirochaetia bacterium]
MAKGSGIFSSKFARGLVVGLAASAMGTVLLLTGALDRLENTTWDLRVQLLAKPSDATDDVIVVFIDQTDLESVDAEYGISWPWPRSVQSMLIDFASASGAASVVYDIVLEDQGWAGADDDRTLQFVAEQFGHLVYAAELRVSEIDRQEVQQQGTEILAEEWPSYLSRPGWTVSGLDSPPDEMVFLTASFPEEFVTASNGIMGFANQQNDQDGVFRRYRLLNYHTDQAVPSLAAAAVLAQTPGQDEVVFDQNTLTFNGIRVPIDSNKATLLGYTIKWERPSNAEKDPEITDFYTRNTFSAWEVLQSALALQAGVDPIIPIDLFTGRHILVGVSASGLLDLRPTPLDSRAPGVTVHAQMLDNLLSGEFMRDFPQWASVALLVLLTVGAALAATYATKTITELLLILGFLAVPVVLVGGGYLLGYWVQFVVPIIALFIALVSANVANYATEGAAKRQIRGMFGRYLSPAVISQLEEDPEAAGLGGKEAEITIFFSDIQKFSVIATKLDADVLVSFLNLYLTPMTNVILDEGGGIDKYEGDAIIAQWGAPIEHADHGQRGLRSVVKCQTVLDELRPQFLEQFGVEVFQRIGMSSGPAIVGNMGSDLRFDYTMIGKAVNLAARLEGA